MLGGIKQEALDLRRSYEQQAMQQQYNALRQMSGFRSIWGVGGLQNAQRMQEEYSPPEKYAPKSLTGELQESVDKWLADVKL